MVITGKSVDDMTLTEVKALVSTLETRNEELVGMVGQELSEAGEFGTAQLALEDIGWRPLSGITDGANSFTLAGLHRTSELCRAVATINPLIERGLEVRTGYIWGSGVSVVPTTFVTGGPGRPRTANTEPKLPEGLDDVLTGTTAQMEIERTAATDGNLFFLVDRKNKEVQRIPFEEITEGVSQRGNRERLLYIRRTWNDWDLELDSSPGQDARPYTGPDFSRKPSVSPDPRRDEGRHALRHTSVWYPTPAAMKNGRANANQANIANQPVDHSKVMVHVAFNRLTGWRWGVPDVLPAIWWTKAYKEYLENCATLTKAYARFAWKVTSDKSKGVRRTAAAMAQAPRTDPATGQPLSVGASAVLGAGQDLASVGRNTSVDFEAGRPLASMVAAALDVPLPALTCDPMLGNRATAESLDAPTRLVMQSRQRIMDETYRVIFRLLGLNVRLRWPEIAEEPVHRRLQAIDMAVRMGVLADVEARTMVLDAWHDKWDDFPAKPPLEKDLPHPLKPKENLENGKPSDSPVEPGRPRQPEPPAYGDHELRDEGTQSHTDQGS
jgi:hypothetical protein